MKWIPINERLPEDNERDKYGRVLVATDLESVLTCVFDAGRFDIFPKHRKVTHWMPLPEPPEEQ